MGEVRVQKAIADIGIASRRAAEKMIEDGRVKINGKRCELGQKIDSVKIIIFIDDEEVSAVRSIDRKR